MVQTTASADYILSPKLYELGLILQTDKATGLLQGVSLASTKPELFVICRYINARQLHQLRERKRQGCKLVYFMDDDLLDPSAWVGLPWRYRWKLFRWAYVYKRQLLALTDEVWVSTPYLQSKYAHLRPHLVTAQPTPQTSQGQHDSAVLVCYHGTASHQADFKWLLPVMQEVLQRNPEVHFELFADKQIASLFRQLPRTAVLHPMSWPQYLAYTQSRSADIGLAPLSPTLFNAARGAVKCMDYTRMNAVGIYTNVPPYRDHVRHGSNGLLLPHNHAVWVQAISDLAHNKAQRLQMLAEAKSSFSVDD